MTVTVAVIPASSVRISLSSFTFDISNLEYVSPYPKQNLGSLGQSRYLVVKMEVPSAGFGLPVIATNVGGLPEAVTDGKTGIIVPSEDEKALADAIVRFFEEDKADEFRANIADEAERFSWDRTSEIVEELFAEYGKQN